jgi:hypothetical protein
MKLEEALDLMISGYEDYRIEDDPDNCGFAQAWETILRCADIEWQRREMATFNTPLTTQTIETKVWKKEGP